MAGLGAAPSLALTLHAVKDPNAAVLSFLDIAFPDAVPAARAGRQASALAHHSSIASGFSLAHGRTERDSQRRCVSLISPREPRARTRSAELPDRVSVERAVETPGGLDHPSPREKPVHSDLLGGGCSTYGRDRWAERGVIASDVSNAMFSSLPLRSIGGRLRRQRSSCTRSEADLLRASRAD